MLVGIDDAAAQQARPGVPIVTDPYGAVGGAVPGDALGNTSDAQFWRQIRRGAPGTVSIPNAQAGVLIRSEGDNWRAWRNGPVTVYGAWVLLGTIGLLALFFALRGRIRIDSGPSGRTVERFNGVERFAHWLTAVSFILLALTGLNLLYGRNTLLPVLGNEVFAVLTQAGKYVHNYVAFAFMAGLVIMFVLWVRDNLPNRYDLIWLAKGGGLFTKGVHPPSKKFNAGQKIIFWLVILGGLSLSLSGIALLFPFQFSFFAATFKVLNVFGLDLPTQLSPTMEMQLSQLWHAIVALFMIAVIMGHIYIGSIGMEGAFDAMGTGRVDENWAREHHSIWLEEVRQAGAGEGAERRQPAE
ncbi:MAG: formate dehydrogenase subunit gamma [Alphaproteobacteria bacterium]|nr:MAG: formate dehydrogenase subunit gamma [Alphaproteobacteria bacterium]